MTVTVRVVVVLLTLTLCVLAVMWQDRLIEKPIPVPLHLDCRCQVTP